MLAEGDDSGASSRPFQAPPKRLAPDKAIRARTVQANANPKRYQELFLACRKFKQYHPLINVVKLDSLTSQPFDASTTTFTRAQQAATRSRSLEWKKATLESASKIDQDIIMSDLNGYEFLFYCRFSMSEGESRQMASDARLLLSQRHPRRAHVEDARYDQGRGALAVDFTSVEQAHPNRGILLARQIAKECNTAEGMDWYSDLAECQEPGLKAASVMYYTLAARDSTDRHDLVLDLASNTYKKCSKVVKGFLGAPWSPFAQRRLIYNIDSRPHVDSTNAKCTLNALTFFGTASVWLVVIINKRPFAFKASAGATILFPASLFEHFTMDWNGIDDRFVSTCWTSNSLGYSRVLQASANHGRLSSTE